MRRVRIIVLALLPVDQVVPTPFQRDLSDAHVKRLEGVIGRIGCGDLASGHGPV